MTTANCPRCSEQVSVPDDASREATVRCPFCRDEYSLAEALAQLPPSLIVVSDFDEAPATALADEEDSPWSALNLDDDDADEVALAPIDDASPATAFDFTSGSATSGGKPTATVRSSSRSRKPKGSPIKSVLSIVIGGLMAFPIAQLILWHLPGDWKRDFGAGPVVAQYVPLIVPEKFRGSKANAESNSGPATQDSGSVIPDFSFGGGEFAAAGASGGANANANNKNANRPKKKKQSTTDTAILNEEPPAEEEISVEDAAAAGADVFGSPLEVPGLELGGLPLIDEPMSPSGLPPAITQATEEPADELPSLGDPFTTSQALEPEVASLAPGNIQNAPQVSNDRVAQSVQAATSGNLAWDSAETGSPSGSLKQEFYVSFSKLGEALTFADRTDDDVATQISETAKLLHEVGKHSAKLAAIEAAGSVWMKWSHEKRKTHGVCLSGQVKSVEPIGDLFETTIESAGQQIAVVSTSDPSEYFVTDSQVLILGAILDDPAKNLGGYEGSRAVVVLDGFHVNVATD